MDTPSSLFVAMLWLFLLPMISGCGSSDSDSGGQTQLQFVNGVLDSPDLIIELEQDDDTISELRSFAYGAASSLVALERGSYGVRVLYLNPDTEFEEVLLETSFALREETIYQAVLSGPFATAELTLLERPADVLADEDEIELRLINLAADSVSAYFGDDSAGLAADAFVATVAPGMASDAIRLPFDDDAEYRARITLDGETVLRFESAEIQVADLSRTTFVVTEPAGLDETVKDLILVRDSGASQPSNERASSAIRILNAIVDGGTQYIRVLEPATGLVLLDADLAQGEATGFTNVRASFVSVEVAPTAADPVIATATVSLNEDEAFTITAGGSVLEDDVGIRASVVAPRKAATQVRFQMVNGLRTTDDEDIDAIDLYALRIGDALADTSPFALGVGYLAGASAVLPATGYDLVATTSGTQSILAGPQRLFAEGGTRVLLSAQEAAAGGPPNRIEISADAD
ncbi:MAG: DUF4397 domain-containing protein [Pseudomonadota bacterium]